MVCQVTQFTTAHCCHGDNWCSPLVVIFIITWPPWWHTTLSRGSVILSVLVIITFEWASFQGKFSCMINFPKMYLSLYYFIWLDYLWKRAFLAVSMDFQDKEKIWKNIYLNIYFSCISWFNHTAQCRQLRTWIGQHSLTFSRNPRHQLFCWC